MDKDDSDWKTAAKAVPELRLLRWLVTGLALVMGLGMIAIVALLWVRLGQPVLPDLPDAITLPDGARAEAETAMKGWIDRWLADRDFVTREEFDAVREMAIKARTENAELKARLDAMEAGRQG